MAMGRGHGGPLWSGASAHPRSWQAFAATTAAIASRKMAIIRESCD